MDTGYMGDDVSSALRNDFRGVEVQLSPPLEAFSLESRVARSFPSSRWQRSP